MPSRYAVLVGCNYPNTPRVNELHGCVNDVKNMRVTLLKRFGFSKSSIHMLVDTEPASTQPTRDNIMQALNKMISNASPGDVLLFHYSGHGSHARRSSHGSHSSPVHGGPVHSGHGGQGGHGGPVHGGHGSHDQFDECIVPCDLKYIYDYEFRVLVNKLPKGTSFTIIADSCFSGQLIDKEREQIGPHHPPSAREKKEKANVVTKPRFLPSEALGSFVPETRAAFKVKVHPDMGILLSGCQSDEYSQEDPKNSCGAFSGALQQVLSQHVDPISNRDLIMAARRIVHGRFEHQHPCLYCSDANADAMFLLQSNSKSDV